MHVHEHTLLAQAVREMAIAERNRIKGYEKHETTVDIVALKLRAERLDRACQLLTEL